MMEFDITERRENKLLNREEIDIDITHHGEATPSENDIRKAIAAELDLDPLTIQVDHVYSATGTATSRGTVTVFDEPVIDELPDEEESEDADEEVEDEDEGAEEEADDEQEDAADEEESEAEEDAEAEEDEKEGDD